MVRTKRTILSIFTLLTVAALCAKAASGSAPAASSLASSYNREVFASTRADADFDGDGCRDSATAIASIYGYEIEINFACQHEKTSLKLEDPGFGARIVAVDIDRDKDQDILVTSPLSSIPIALWLNDGKGHFERGNPLRCQADFLGNPFHYSSQNDPTNQTRLLPRSRYSVCRLSRANFDVCLESAGVLYGNSLAARLRIRTDPLSTRSPPFFASF